MQFVFPLVLVGLLLVMWLASRSQSRRRGELAHMQATLEVGDEVMLTSGIFGTLRTVDGDRVGLEVSDGVVVSVARGAVGELVTESDPPDDPAPDARDPGDTDVSEEN